MHIYLATFVVRGFPSNVGFFGFIRWDGTPDETVNRIYRSPSPILTDEDIDRVIVWGREQLGGKRDHTNGWATFEFDPVVDLVCLNPLGVQ